MDQSLFPSDGDAIDLPPLEYTPKNFEVRRPGQQFPDTVTRSIALVGPVALAGQPNWRTEALRILDQIGFDGVVYYTGIEGQTRDSIPKWVRRWQDKAVNAADAVVGNIGAERTQRSTGSRVGLIDPLAQGKAFLAIRPDQDLDPYVDDTARPQNAPVSKSLREALVQAAAFTSPGIARTGGERFIPLHLYRTRVCQSYLKRVKAQNNELTDAFIKWVLLVGNRIPLIFGLKPQLQHAKGIKGNEDVVLRPNGVSIALVKPNWRNIDLSEVVVAKEVRAGKGGILLKLPGGSDGVYSSSTDVEVALHELAEEVGVQVDPKSLLDAGEQTVDGGLAGHTEHVLVSIVDGDMMRQVRADSDTEMGVVEETEALTREVITLREMRQRSEGDLVARAQASMVSDLLMTMQAERSSGLVAPIG